MKIGHNETVTHKNAKYVFVFGILL